MIISISPTMMCCAFITEREKKGGKKWSCHSHGNTKIMKTKMCSILYDI